MHQRFTLGVVGVERSMSETARRTSRGAKNASVIEWGRGLGGGKAPSPAESLCLCNAFAKEAIKRSAEARSAEALRKGEARRA